MLFNDVFVQLPSVPGLMNVPRNTLAKVAAHGFIRLRRTPCAGPLAAVGPNFSLAASAERSCGPISTRIFVGRLPVLFFLSFFLLWFFAFVVCYPSSYLSNDETPRIEPRLGPSLA